MRRLAVSDFKSSYKLEVIRIVPYWPNIKNWINGIAKLDPQTYRELFLKNDTEVIQRNGAKTIVFNTQK